MSIENKIEDRCSVLLGWLGVAFSLVLGCVYLGSQLEVKIVDIYNLLKACGLFWFIIFVAIEFKFFKNLALSQIYSFRILIVLVFLIIAGLFMSFAGLQMEYPLAILGFLFLFRHLWLLPKLRLDDLCLPNKKYLFAGILSFLFYCVWCAVKFWGAGYLSPWFEYLFLLGEAKSDTLYHATIANMISQYKVPSIGVDGLLFQKYHFGSHLIFAAISRLTGLSMIVFYNLCIPIVFGGLLLIASLDFLKSVLKLKTNFSTDLIFPNLGIVLIVLSFVHIGFLSPQTEEIYAIWSDQFISESFLVSIVLMLLFASTIIVFLDNYLKTPSKNQFEENFFFYLYTPLMLSVIYLSKNSTAIIACSALLIFFIDKKLFLSKKIIYSLILSSICVLASLAVSLPVGNLGSNSAGQSGVVFGSFVTKYASGDWFGFLFYHFLTVWLYIFFRLLNEFLLNKNYYFFTKILKAEFLDLRLIVITLFVGLIPSILFDIPGGSAIYFADVILFFAIPLCVIEAYKLFSYLRAQSNRMGRIIFVLSGLVLCKWSYESGRTRILDYVDYVKTTQSRVASVSTKQSKNGIIYKKLVDFGFNNNGIHRDAAFYVPRSNQDFWSSTGCLSVSFVIQALTGFALIDGTPLESCTSADTNYGYIVYGLKKLDGSDVNICNKAKEKGFTLVYSFLSVDPWIIQQESCK